MLHSAAPSSFNMFPFGHPPQHPGPAPPPHHGEMFHATTHHHNPHPQQTETAPKPKFLFKMPRVVPNQKEKFESDEFLKRHSREGEVSMGVRDYCGWDKSHPNHHHYHVASNGSIWASSECDSAAKEVGRDKYSEEIFIDFSDDTLTVPSS